MAKRSHGSASYGPAMMPSACWFPMSLFAMMMMQQASRSGKAKKRIAKPKRAPLQQPSQSSVPVPGPPRLDLRAEQDPVEPVFWEACHRKLEFFCALASLPRTGIFSNQLKTVDSYYWFYVCQQKLFLPGPLHQGSLRSCSTTLSWWRIFFNLMAS